MTVAPGWRLTGHTGAVLVLLGGVAVRLVGLLVLAFVLFRRVPGDPVLAGTGGRPTTAAQIAARRHELGLDRPLGRQFLSYLRHTLHGQLGTSFIQHRPVAQLIGERLGPTLLLAGSATVLSVAIGLLSGVKAGWQPGSRHDRVSTATALALWATPTFWLGLVLLVVAGVGIGPLPGLLPTGGMRSTHPTAGVAGFADVLQHLALPCLTLTAVQFGQYHLLVRSCVAAERDRFYLTLARGKGLRDGRVRWRHAVPNALLPTMTLAFVNLGFVISGAVAVETVFSWPGLGQLAYEALQGPDLPLLQGTFLLFSASVIVATAAARIAGVRLDPRTRDNPS
jgi:peptide/nickel transport system permease protein